MPLNLSNQTNTIKTPTSSVPSEPGFSGTNQEMVDKAFDLASTQVRTQGIDKNSPQGMDAIINQTKNFLGLPSDNAPNIGSNSMATNSNMVTPSQNPNKPGLVANPTNKQMVVEKKVREVQDSSAFTDTVPENAGAWKKGKTGPEINSEAKKRLDLMRAKGFGTDL